MRPGLVRNVGLGISAVALVWLAACDDNPLSFDVKEGTGIFVNPSEMVVPAGRTGKLESRTVNPANQSTFQEIAWAIDPTCGSGAITVTDDPDEAELIEAGIKPPGAFAVTGGSTLGQSCVVLTSGSLATQVDVTVVAEAIEFTSGPDTLRAGETGLMTAQLVDAAGSAVSPYDPADAGWTSDNEAAADFTDDVGNFSTAEAGTAVLTVTWVGTESNGTNVNGVLLEDEHVLTVIPNVPASAALGNDDDFGTQAAGVDVTSEVVVSDAQGNQNNDETEILSCTAVSDAPLVATAVCDVVPTNSVDVIVTVTTVGAGTANISGDVTTTEGTFPYGPGAVVVLAPSVTGIAPAAGTVGTALTITGVNLTAAGFETLVTVDGAAMDEMFYVTVAETQIDVLVPDLGNNGDEFEIGVSVGGVPAPVTFTYTQTANAAADEPANDNPGTATVLALPADLVGSFEGADVDDFYLVTVGGEFTVDLDWDDHSVDLDILIDDENNGNTFPCGFDGASSAAPEQHVCTVPAGNYLVWINNFSGADHPTSYRLMITE